MQTNRIPIPPLHESRTTCELQSNSSYFKQATTSYQLMSKSKNGLQLSNLLHSTSGQSISVPRSLRRFEHGLEEQRLYTSVATAIDTESSNRLCCANSAYGTELHRSLETRTAASISFACQSVNYSLTDQSLLNALRQRARAENDKLMRVAKTTGSSLDWQLALTVNQSDLPPGCELGETNSTEQHGRDIVKNQDLNFLVTSEVTQVLCCVIISTFDFIIWTVSKCISRPKCCACLSHLLQARSITQGKVSHKLDGVQHRTDTVNWALFPQRGVLHKISVSHLTARLLLVIIWLRHAYVVAYISVALFKRGPVIKISK
ncbi:hypothetical protein V1512DRAFT_262814 [Lipomyces arxii]|uniref:uncharacterized protein n=1 Tax=Lipomyces arxii TaxID=56418 RepID=UPI0034CD213B